MTGFNPFSSSTGLSNQQFFPLKPPVDDNSFYTAPLAPIITSNDVNPSTTTTKPPLHSNDQSRFTTTKLPYTYQPIQTTTSKPPPQSNDQPSATTSTIPFLYVPVQIHTTTSTTTERPITTKTPVIPIVYIPFQPQTTSTTTTEKPKTTRAPTIPFVYIPFQTQTTPSTTTPAQPQQSNDQPLTTRQPDNPGHLTTPTTDPWTSTKSAYVPQNSNKNNNKITINVYPSHSFDYLPKFDPKQSNDQPAPTSPIPTTPRMSNDDGCSNCGFSSSSTTSYTTSTSPSPPKQSNDEPQSNDSPIIIINHAPQNNSFSNSNNGNPYIPPYYLPPTFFPVKNNHIERTTTKPPLISNDEALSPEEKPTFIITHNHYHAQTNSPLTSNDIPRPTSPTTPSPLSSIPSKKAFTDPEWEAFAKKHGLTSQFSGQRILPSRFSSPLSRASSIIRAPFSSSRFSLPSSSSFTHSASRRFDATSPFSSRKIPSSFRFSASNKSDQSSQISSLKRSSFPQIGEPFPFNLSSSQLSSSSTGPFTLTSPLKHSSFSNRKSTSSISLPLSKSIPESSKISFFPKSQFSKRSINSASFTSNDKTNNRLQQSEFQLSSLENVLSKSGTESPQIQIILPTSSPWKPVRN